MKKYRLVKQEGTEREVFGETVTELKNGLNMVAIKGESNPEQLQSFRDEWERLIKDSKDDPNLFVALPGDVNIEHLVLEEVDESE